MARKLFRLLPQGNSGRAQVIYDLGDTGRDSGLKDWGGAEPDPDESVLGSLHSTRLSHLPGQTRTDGKAGLPIPSTIPQGRRHTARAHVTEATERQII